MLQGEMDNVAYRHFGGRYWLFFQGKQERSGRVDGFDWCNEPHSDAQPTRT
jgi:hypothetical protein